MTVSQCTPRVHDQTANFQQDDILHENNTYKAIRILGPRYNMYYSIWCNNEHELYDMDVSSLSLTKGPNTHTAHQVDPAQMHNLLSANQEPTATIAGLAIHKVVARLDSLLFVLKSCKGSICREPWKSLHPKGDVLTLEDALSTRFDHFYEVEQQRVEYNFCSNGYLIDAEGPMWEERGSVFRDGLMWYEWV